MNEIERFGRFLRELRGNRSLRDLQTALNLGSPQTISNWERGYQLPPQDKIEIIKTAYVVVAESREAGEFDRLYADALRKKALSTGPLSLEEDQGVKPMVDGLNDLAALAKHDREFRYVLHSISTQGFMTERNPDLQSAVVGCAHAGVDVVFFPQPGEESISNAEANLKSALRRGVGNYAARFEDEGVDQNSIFNQLSLLNHKHFPPTFPSEDIEEWADTLVSGRVGQRHNKCATTIAEVVECLSAPAVWLGSFLRFLVELKVNKALEKSQPAYGSLERTCPSKFQVTKIWLHFVTYNPGLAAKRHAWLPMFDDAGNFANEYRAKLSALRTRSLLESRLIFTPKN